MVLFALLRTAVFDVPLEEEMRTIFSDDMTKDLVKMSAKHDLLHLLALGLKKNGLSRDDAALDRIILKAVYRCEQLNYERAAVCEALENAQIAFLPLKGSVLRSYYPEEWMRTSCDVDILVHSEDLARALTHLRQTLHYEEKERGTHDVLLRTPAGQSVELHFDLVEEGRANLANRVLSSVWENASVREGCHFQYVMSDAFFYFYHLAHMAKHMENGGCGIRPFIDLMLLDKLAEADVDGRTALLEEGKLTIFAAAARKLGRVWFEGEAADERSLKLQDYILHGGVYGASDNKVAVQQKKKGGQVGYLLSRVFVPYDKLRRYYPVLERHRWLTPVMQVRRWFMLLDPAVARMAKKEIELNSSLEKSLADEMGTFLDEIGL